MNIIKSTITAYSLGDQGINAGEILQHKFGSHLKNVSNNGIDFTCLPGENRDGVAINVNKDVLATLKHVDEVNWQTNRLLPLGPYNQAVALVLSNGKSLTTYHENCGLYEYGTPKKIIEEYSYKTKACERAIAGGTGVCDDFAKVSAALLASKDLAQPVSIAYAKVTKNGKYHTFSIVGDPRVSGDVVVSDPWVIYPSAHLLSQNTLVNVQEVGISFTYPPHAQLENSQIFDFDPQKEFKVQTGRNKNISIMQLNAELASANGRYGFKDVWHITQSNNIEAAYVNSTDTHVSRYPIHYLNNVKQAIDYIDNESIQNGTFINKFGL
ncbi:hypothetical protein ABK905_14680 [Acerihabitans sp. KWT182]|uniref:Transglutaminase-like domain-containing protein n=1 Tax=Acerihabitans sp. KWT182 TaxID=3157919 RepID=A0AAU7Q5B3_9GAMM